MLFAVPVFADEFSEFRIPEHRLFSWNGSLSSAFGRGTAGGGVSSQSNRNTNGAISSQMFWLHDSDPSQTMFAFNGDAQAVRQHSRGEYVFVFPSAVSRGRGEAGSVNAGERWQLSLEQRNYPWRTPVGWQVRLEGQADYRQQWTHQSNDDRHEETSETRENTFQIHADEWDYHYRAVGELRLGYGRVRDATGVLDARVFEERLRQSGALTRALTPGARQRLAAIAYTRYAFGATHERPAKLVWQAIEQVLRDDGALAEGAVSPEKAFRAGESYLGGAFGSPALPLASSPVTRLAGSFAGLLVTARHEHQISRVDQHTVQSFTLNDTLDGFFDYDYARHDRSGQDAILAAARAEYYRPLGLRWQLDASETALVPLKEHRDGFELTSDVRLLAIVADRWLAEGFVNQRRRIDRGGGAGSPLNEDSWAVAYGASATYFLEDHLALHGELGEQQLSTRSGANSNRNLNASLSLTYRLAGRLYAPGIVGAPASGAGN